VVVWTGSSVCRESIIEKGPMAFWFIVENENGNYMETDLIDHPSLRHVHVDINKLLLPTDSDVCEKIARPTTPVVS